MAMSDWQYRQVLGNRAGWQPRLLGAHGSVARLLRKAARDARQRMRLQDRWEQNAPADWCAHGRVVGWADGVVWLEADSASWAVLLRRAATRVARILKVGSGRQIRIIEAGRELEELQADERRVDAGDGVRGTD